MLDSFFHKSRLFLSFSLLLIAFSSCEKTKSNELKLLDSFLQQNHSYNTKRLNRQKGDYVEMIKRITQMNTKKHAAITTSYEQLIAKVDRAMISKESNIKSLVQEYDEFLIDIKSVLATYYKEKLDQYFLTTDHLNFNAEYRLKMMKNNLTTAIIYTYESFTGNMIYSDTGSRYLRVRTTVKQNEHQTKIILFSNVFLLIKQENLIIVDKIIFNGFEKKMDFNITKNHGFTDIILDSLTSGTYKIEGTVQYFNRNGKTAIPFREEFKVQ